MNTNLISSDIARCYGDPSPCCDTCASKLQIPLDDESRWYPQMRMIPENGRCVFKIEAAKGWETR